MVAPPLLISNLMISLFRDATQGSAKSKEEFEQLQKRLKIFHDITRVVGNIFDIFTGIASQVALLIYSAEFLGISRKVLYEKLEAYKIS